MSARCGYTVALALALDDRREAVRDLFIDILGRTIFERWGRDWKIDPTKKEEFEADVKEVCTKLVEQNQIFALVPAIKVMWTEKRAYLDFVS